MAPKIKIFVKIKLTLLQSKFNLYYHIVLIHKNKWNPSLKFEGLNLPLQLHILLCRFIFTFYL